MAQPTPTLSRKPKMNYQTYLCPQVERERVATEAKRAGVSMSELVRTLVAEALDNREEERFASRLVSLENQVANTLREARSVGSRVGDLYALNKAQEKEITARVERIEESLASLGTDIRYTLMLCGAQVLSDPTARTWFLKVVAKPDALLEALMKPVPPKA